MPGEDIETPSGVPALLLRLAQWCRETADRIQPIASDARSEVRDHGGRDPASSNVIPFRARRSDGADRMPRRTVVHGQRGVVVRALTLDEVDALNREGFSIALKFTDPFRDHVSLDASGRCVAPPEFRAIIEQSQVFLRAYLTVRTIGVATGLLEDAIWRLPEAEREDFLLIVDGLTVSAHGVDAIAAARRGLSRMTGEPHGAA